MANDKSIESHNIISTIIPELEVELHRLLGFWVNRMPDEDNGGFYGRIDGNNKLHSQSDKGVILNSRILWTFANVSRFHPHVEYNEMADRAFDYLKKYFFDFAHGGVYWMLNFHGKPVNKRKQIYAQAFAIYALSEYYQLSSKQKSLDLAITLFELIEEKSFDKKENGYLEALDEKWHEIDDLRLSDKDANEKKTMNTHLHILEAYTNLFRVWKNDHLKKQLRNLITLFLEKFINDKGHFELFFDENWHLKSDETSFGHDIEGSWLLCEAAEVLGDQDLIEKTRINALNMVEHVLKHGLDSDGGIMNEASGDKLTDTDKHWWPQAEALVGFANVWQISSNKNYLRNLNSTWEFIKGNLLDKQHGEWHWRVNKDGKVIDTEDIAGPWKCPYHNGRALMELIHRLSAFNT